MNIFARILEQKKKDLTNITFLERPVTTKDLFLNSVVVIDFLVGQEFFFYIFKYPDKNKEKNVLCLKDLQDIISDETKIISIHFKDLKENKFKNEYMYIQNFIKQVGGDHVE